MLVLVADDTIPQGFAGLFRKYDFHCCVFCLYLAAWNADAV